MNINPHRDQQRYGPGTIKTKFRNSRDKKETDTSSIITEHQENKGNESSARLDLRERRSLEEKEGIRDTESKKEDMIKPEKGKSFPAVGAESGRKSASCLTAGVTDGRHPKHQEIQVLTNTPHAEQRRIIRLDRPKNIKGDGRSYLRFSPMTSMIKLGGPDQQPQKGLMDPCSNTCIIDENLLRSRYPTVKVHPLETKIIGVGSKPTQGFTVIPIWVDCVDPTRPTETVTVELDIEAYIVKEFTAGILIGLDALIDYNIDLSLPGHTATVSSSGTEYCFPLLSQPSEKPLRIKIMASEAVTVPGRTSMAVGLKGRMREGLDYIFSPGLITPRGLPPSPQLAHSIIDKGVKFVMFTNHSHHPIHIDRGQYLGEAEAVSFGAKIVPTGHFVDWADLLAPTKKGTQSDGIEPPCHLSDVHYEDLLSFNAHGEEIERPPRSITEDEVLRISRKAAQRRKGDRLPAEDDDEQPPAPPMPSTPSGGPNICGKLSEEQRRELSNLLREFPECFSDGTTIGLIDPDFFQASIDLNGPIPPPQQNRPVGVAKRAVIDETIDQLIGWDVIEPSHSPTASAVVLVWQNNKWRFCVDFRPLNAVTKGDAYPMLRSDYVFSALADKRFFSMLDAVKGYHQMSVKEEDRFKTAFISHRGLYQYKKLPFGLRNAPAMFQRMMDQVLGNLRWIAALVYIDDVIVFSGTWEEHLAHLRVLLRSASKIGLKFHLSKCRFGYDELRLLGMGLSRYGLQTVDEKVKAITDLSPPETIGELHRLVGMFSYYRNFIRNFAKIATPLNELKRNEPGAEYHSKKQIKWSEACQKSFDELKQRLSTAPILAHPKFDGRPFILYTDASAGAFAAVLCQLWTRQDYDPGTTEDDEADIPPMAVFTATDDSWKADYIADPTFRHKYQTLLKQSPHRDEQGFSIHEDQTLRYKTIHGEKICLPLARIPDALKASHDVLGHFGSTKTYERISASYYRPKLSSVVDAYIRFCPQCLTNKTTRNKPPGNLALIDPPTGRTPTAFESINLDLIVGLPKSNGFDAILVVVDRFTKTGIFTPTKSDFTAESIAEIFMEKIVSRGFLPSKFITDRDPRLIMSFWKTLCRRLKIDHRKTAAFHAQTDGAAERLNQTLEIALRNYVSPRQHDWSKHLYLIELAYNTSKNASSGFSPYELLYAQPQDPVERLLRPHIPPMIDDIDMDVHEGADDMLLDNAARLRDAQQAIVKAMESYKSYYDRRHGPTPQYKVGDYASLRLDKHPVAIIKRNKLSQQKLPPYRITKVATNGRSVELDMPPTISIHPRVSVQHIEPAPSPREDPWLRGPPDELGEQSIVDHRDTKAGNRKFRIHWEGLGADRDEWRARKNVDQALIETYEEELRREAFTATTDSLSKNPETSFPLKIPDEGRSIERPILYISRSTKPYEKSYESTELELGCVTWAMTRLRHYVEGSTVILISDHEPLKGVINASPGTQYSSRIDKFRMLLMPFVDEMTILYKPGAKMTNVDPLSRARYVGSTDAQHAGDGRQGKTGGEAA